MSAAAEYARWIRDRWYVRRSLQDVHDGRAVVIFLFHSLFRDEAEVSSGHCDPQQGITVGFFREFVESLLATGIPIVDLAGAIGAPRPGLSAVLTFDDGYYNNVRALEVLERCDVPATFFISTSHVEQGKAFWWDALYRAARRTGTGRAAIAEQIRGLKTLRNDEIEDQLRRWFGSAGLRPVSDTDRPFTPDELASFARSRHVAIGNHTSDHAILVNYSAEDARAQIAGAQRYLAGLTGVAPAAIAYPNGNYDDSVMAISRELGLGIGVTVRPGANPIPATGPLELLRLTVRAIPGAARQGRTFGSLAGHRRAAAATPSTGMACARG